MNITKENLKKVFLIFCWGLYDLANQFFALNIVSLYFVRWITIEKASPEIFYSIAFGISTFFVAIAAPLLGTMSDMINRRRPFLIYLTFLSIIFTMVLGVSENIFVGLLLFMIANFGCQSAIVFYNALMVNVAPKNKIGLVSGIGKTLGYTGAILALYLIRPIVLKSGYRATFLPTGVLFFIFSLPCLIFIKDQGEKKQINLISFLKKDKILEIFRTVKTTGFTANTFPGLTDFLKASFFGLCAVNTIILFMSVYATKAFKLNEIQVINLITFSTFFAIFGSFTSGYISDRIGARITMILVFIIWIICIVFAAVVKNIAYFWLLGSVVGMVLGATWVVSRTLAIRLVPNEKIGEVFGLFNLVGYLSCIVGPVFWGLILLFLSPLGEAGYRLSLLSLNSFLLLGLIFLLRIPKVNSRTS